MQAIVHAMYGWWQVGEVMWNNLDRNCDWSHFLAAFCLVGWWPVCWWCKWQIIMVNTFYDEKSDIQSSTVTAVDHKADSHSKWKLTKALDFPPARFCLVLLMVVHHCDISLPRISPIVTSLGHRGLTDIQDDRASERDGWWQFPGCVWCAVWCWCC